MKTPSDTADDKEQNKVTEDKNVSSDARRPRSSDQSANRSSAHTPLHELGEEDEYLDVTPEQLGRNPSDEIFD